MAGKISRFAKLKMYNKKRILVLSSILISFIVLASLKYIDINANLESEDQKYIKNEDFQFENLKTQGLTSDNSFIGTGAPWNVTHYANYTKSNLDVSFYNNSYDDTNAQVELYGWNGYQLNSTITNLYDTRNWINGTFHAGSFGGSPSGSDDSEYVANWTFREHDITGYTNPMSGNYYDTSSSVSDGQDCLELAIDGDTNGRYDVGDKCCWETVFEIDRGDVEEAWLRFSVRAYSADNYNNHMVLQVVINGKVIWGTGLASMLEVSGNPSPGNWGEWYSPYPIYLDGEDEDIFPDGIKNMNVTLEFKRVSGTASGYGDHALLFDNVSLIVKAKAKPSHLDLQLNNNDVKDNANYGEGYLGITGNWNGSLQTSVIANFSSDSNWPLTFEEEGSWLSYKIELETNLNLFTNKFTPESYYIADPDLSYQGSSFIASNNSNVNWTTYAHMEIPAGYEETNMTIEYPSDYSLTGVFFSQNPNSLSQTSIKEYGTKKIVNIPVSSITSNTNGFWKLTAVSPNYCSELNIYNGPTATGPWVLNNAFISGDYINITGKIESPQLDISNYIGNTEANLFIRFPDSTIWTGASQIKQVNDNGIVYFDPFMIPNNIPNYKAGEYKAIITWNNSYSSFQSNETGIIYKNFTIIHDSKLVPDQGIDFIENVFDDRIVNIKVSYNDLIDNKAIESAYVYTDFTGAPEILSEISPGYYLYEFNASKASAGNNTVTIYAEHEFYLNKEVNITVEVIKQTVLTVENGFDIVSVAWNDNFTVKFSYTEKNTGFGIDAFDDVNITWNGEYHLIQPSVGQYELECNTSAYSSRTLQSLLISINPYTYQAQSALINVQITELGSYLKLFVNQIPTNYSDTIQIDLGEDINITVQYQDGLNGNHLPNATVELLGIDFLNETNNQYTIIIGAESLEPGISPVTVFAQKDNYNSQSISFFIRVTEKPTNIKLILNGDPTTDPVIDVTIGTLLNITVYYTDNQTGLHIGGASVKLIPLTGEGDTIEFNETLNQYSILLNTSELNVFSVNRFSIEAYANNFQIKTIDNLRITVNRIMIMLRTESGEPFLTGLEGDTVRLSIILNNTNVLPYGELIKNANITFRWYDRSGKILDPENDGIYEVDLVLDVPVDTYIIRIWVEDEFNDYYFEYNSENAHEITLNVNARPGLNLTWLIIIFSSVIIGLVSIFTIYQKHFKYPPLVRKIRKLRKKVRKGRKIKPIGLSERSEIVKETLNNKIEQIELKKIKSEKDFKVQVDSKIGEADKLQKGGN